MPFHLGKPILVMSILAVAAGIVGMATRSSSGRADVEHWAFSEQNFRIITSKGAGESLVDQFARETGHRGEAKLVQYRAMNTRLASLFMSRTGWPELPDVVDIEIGSVGRYFRPPVAEVGLLPLNDLLVQHGWLDKIVKNRLATWSKDGVIFGVPQDVHPVMVIYNDAKFRAAGIDLSMSTTWDDFIADCRAFQTYWAAHGEPRCHAFEMDESGSGTLVTMLLERGINLVDKDGSLHLTDEQTLDTLVRYCLMLRGDDGKGGGAIGVSPSPGNDAFALDLANGYVNVMLCADWRLKYARDYGGGAVAGKMKIMPMPRWPDSPYRTSTNGGSMVGIPRNARDPELAFRYIEKMYLSPEAIAIRAKGTYVVPPIPSAWPTIATDEPDAFFSGQPVKKIIAGLAADVPPRYVSPASAAAEGELSLALIDVLAYTKSHGEDGLREHCRAALATAAGRVQRALEHARFEP